MSIVIPPAVNYPSPLIAVPDDTYAVPAEGYKKINCEVDWTVTDNGKGSLYYNLQNNATLAFRQICGIVVDNSACGADLEFIWPDTGLTIGVPAYTPYAVLPVFTGATQFYLVATGKTLLGDVTRFQILNFAPQPVVVPITQHQNTTSVASIALTGAGSTQLIPTTVNGTLEGLSILVALNKPAASFNDLLVLSDNDSTIFWEGNVAADVTDPGGVFNMVNMSNLFARFHGGLRLGQTGGATPGGTVDVNLYYRAP